MNKKETKEVYQNFYDAYRGILFTSRGFADGETKIIKYEFDSPELKQLESNYELKQKAGKGGDFQKAQKLVKWLTPLLAHDSMFSLKNHGVQFNAPALLEYALAGNGLNCVGKSKILQECCLALKIFARTVVLYPASPYDSDNHVVTEIYDRKINKWIMLDVTAGGSFYDDKKTPLSCMEIRELLAVGKRVYFANAGKNPANADALYERHFYCNMYFAKNLFRFEVDEFSGFGVKAGERWIIAPAGYDVAEAEKLKYEYMIDTMQRQNAAEYIPALEKRLEQLKTAEYKTVSPLTLTRAPL